MWVGRRVRRARWVRPIVHLGTSCAGTATADRLAMPSSDVTAPVRSLAQSNESTSAIADTVGELIDGRYELRELLGVGGMGIVYLARRVDDDSVVALKMLRPELLSDPTLSARLRREAEAVRRVQHPNVVRLLDAGEVEGLGPYLAFEHLDGQSLTDRLSTMTRLSLDEALDVADQVLAALEAAHAVGVIHRDLKPDNVFLMDDEAGSRVKVLDFGISRLLADAADRAPGRLTRTGTVLGTPIYMAPEQALGEPTQDERVDVYSAGVMLYEMLSGAVPHDGENYGQILAHVLNAFPIPLDLRVPTLDETLVDIVHRAIDRDAANRFASAAEMRDAISSWRRGGHRAHSTAAIGTQGHEQLVSPHARVRPLAVLCAGVLALGAVLASRLEPDAEIHSAAAEMHLASTIVAPAPTVLPAEPVFETARARAIAHWRRRRTTMSPRPASVRVSLVTINPYRSP